jgi:UDP-GlcNAc:undecaprenyl-phosphate GlcNAc-1-phosphate transferase
MLAALFISLVSIPQLMMASDRLGLIDRPGARRVHAHATPRSGGIGIAIGAIVPLLFFLPRFDKPILAYLGAALIIILFGIWDDRSNLDYRVKVLGQALAVIVFIASGFAIDHLPLLTADIIPPSLLSWLMMGVSGFFILAVTNAFNLHDGLDGLAAGSSILSLGAIAVIGFRPDALAIPTLLAVTVIGAILGFLRYNTHPAVIFMGDTGSQFLGFTVAALAILLSQSGDLPHPTALMFLVGLPALDTAMVMYLRLKAGRSPFSPDKNHIHHKLLALGFRHHESVAVIYGIQAVFVGCAIAFRLYPDWLLIVLYLTICAACIIAYKAFERSGWRPVQAHRPKISANPKLLQHKSGWQKFHDAARLAVALIVLLYLILGGTIATISHDLSVVSLIVAGGLLALLAANARYATMASRLGAYIAMTIVAYSLIPANADLDLWWVSSTAVAFIALALAVASGRLAADDSFKFTNFDLLVGLILAVSLLLPLQDPTSQLFRSVALQLLPLFYGVELLLGARSTAKTALQVGSITSLILIGMKGII